ncbi:MAG TPA: hypothetical protein VGK41_00180, partial [Solirubrobacterales bacterium]
TTETRGQRVIRETMAATGYDPEGDYSDEELIEYKNSLEDQLLAALDRPGLTVTLVTNHEDTAADSGLAATLCRVADQVADGELCGTVYDTTGDDFLGSYDLTYSDTLGRASDQAGRSDVSDPRAGR